MILRVAPSPRSETARFAWLSDWVGTQEEVFRWLRTIGWPLLDFALRIGLAQGFFVSGVLKVTHWQTAIDLATTVYPVSWMNPVTAAYTGAAIELVGSILLAAGLLTRGAALAMLILTLVVQTEYNATDGQLISAALFGWYVLHGAGPFSLDRLLARGFADIALPFAGGIVHATAWLRRNLAPVYLSLMRGWLAVALLAAGIQSALQPGRSLAGLEAWLPIQTVQIWPAALLVGAGALLAAGLFSRCVAIALALTSAGTAMMMPAAGDRLLLFGALGLLTLFGAGDLSLDALVGRALRRRLPEIDGKPAFSLEGLPRIVIVGAGFGGIACATALHQRR